MNANFRIGRSYKVISGTYFARTELLHTYKGFDKVAKRYIFSTTMSDRQILSKDTLLSAKLVDNLHYVKELYVKSN
jgi:hypothetical protein